ncbi:MAG: phosphate acetyltransferase [Aerococcus sp.]|nr:phosphate acetyltransferase [Aerococcus sp.]
MSFIDELKDAVSGKNVRIVFPEGTDERVLTSAIRLQNDGLVTPVVLGNPDDIKRVAKENNVSADELEIIDPDNYDAYDQMVADFVERRNGKTSEDKAREQLRDANYFGTMLVYQGKVDGLVSGAAHTTGETVRPALQIIKTKPGVKLTSGAFIMMRGDERYLFADCAINIDPDEEQLAEIGLQAGHTAEMFNIDPKIAFLSFSTKGSASHPWQEKVAKATEIAKEQAPDSFMIDGEMQFDAAFVPEVGKSKAPDSDVAGQAKVFVFPDIQAGNIGYKLAQRLGNFEAMGPVLQGMAKPISDLSRGCSAEDVYNIALLTARQALAED